MNQVGRALRRAFEQQARLTGQTVFIHESFGTPEATSFETRGVKGTEDKNPRQVIFRFLNREEIPIGAVLQIKGSRDFWKVTDTEDQVYNDLFVSMMVRVEKINEAGQAMRLNDEGRAVYYSTTIQGHNYGAIAQGGKGNIQNVTLTNTNNPNFDQALASLVELIRTAQISDDDKQELEEEVGRVNKLALREPAPGLLDRAKSRLDMIKLAVTGTDIAIKAAPHLDTLWELLKQRFGST